MTLSKDAILEVHRRLYRVRRRLEDRGVAAATAFREYDAANVTPLRMDLSKGAHALAILGLAASIERALERDHA